jgi:predicted Zn-dependent peptidase
MASPTVSQFPNGMTVIVEEMDTVKSAAYSLTIPSGILYDELGRVGASLILTELTAKGAGNYDSRALMEAFDSI